MAEDCKAVAKPLSSGKRLHNYGKSQVLMGKLTISMAIFNGYVSHCQRVTLSFMMMVVTAYRIKLDNVSI